jgi:hypothetical protein
LCQEDKQGRSADNHLELLKHMNVSGTGPVGDAARIFLLNRIYSWTTGFETEEKIQQIGIRTKRIVITALLKGDGTE